MTTRFRSGIRTAAVLAAFVCAATASRLDAQSTAPQVPAADAAATAFVNNAVFDVASIHPIRDTDPHSMSMRISFDDKGNFLASGVSARTLMGVAWRMDETRVIGGPEWLASERMTITAKMDEASGAQFAKLDKDTQKLARQHMLEVLLADRFQLKSHWETRQMPVLALDVAKDGLKLHESPALPPDPTDGSQPKPHPGSSMFSSERKVTATRINLDGLAAYLSQRLHQLVQNQTGLKGIYDLTLEWAPDETREAAAATYDGKAGAAVPADASGPSIYTALEEQLGLKLVARKSPVEVLVVDSIEKPSEN